jgi:hypothetical protein
MKKIVAAVAAVLVATAVAGPATGAEAGLGWRGPPRERGVAAAPVIGTAVAAPYAYGYEYYAAAPVYYESYVPAPVYYSFYGPPAAYGPSLFPACSQWRYRYRVC